MGIHFYTCRDDHTHISWVEIPTSEEMRTLDDEEEEDEEEEEDDEDEVVAAELN
jgi:hypothetical protein